MKVILRCKTVMTVISGCKAVQFSPLTKRLITDDSAEILFQSFLQETIVSSSGMSREVHSFMSSIQRFLCWLQCCQPSKVSWRMLLERLSRCVTCLNHASFSPLTVARRGSCWPATKLILLHTQSSSPVHKRQCDSLFITCVTSWWDTKHKMKMNELGRLKSERQDS